ncbi:MAG TPA: N-acetyltransferase [Edaphobacter sp.]|jgi:ribosomal-protein-alanine N-acetyltransferase|nr:N-acetyltransferase [Edaphobacter sp.]
MSNKIVVRDYRPTDLIAMFRLDEACFAEEFRFDLESMREFAEEPNVIVRIAENGCGGIAGFVVAHVERIASELQAYLVTLDVAREYRRRGVAKRLMSEAESQAAKAGVRWIQLHVFTGNEAAIHLYEKLGYRRVKIHRGYYGRAGLDAIVYSKELAYPDA